MQNLLTIVFEAHNAALNHHRRYTIAIGRDLFDHWTVSFGYGRVGTSGQEVRHAGQDPIPLRRTVEMSLRRRLSAPKWIGCRYELKELRVIDEKIAGNWLPAKLLSEFGVLDKLAPEEYL